MKENRDKMFSGKVCWKDLTNKRYITRKPIYDFLIKHQNDFKGDVLDFGCGSKQYISILSRYADSYTGLDVEGAENNGFIAEDVVYYDGKNIPFENEKFDVVCSIEVFEHVEELDYVLVEINRILKPGGQLIFSCPMTFPMHLVPWDFRRFTKYGIEKMLQDAGYGEIDIEGSTCEQDTIRRMKIMCKSQKRKKVTWFNSKIDAIYVIYANLLFLSRKNKDDIINSNLPVNFLVSCKKG